MSRPADPLRRAVYIGITDGLGFEDIAAAENVRVSTVRHVWDRLVSEGMGGAALSLRRKLVRSSFASAEARASTALSLRRASSRGAA